jgi:hypothetical protein
MDAILRRKAKPQLKPPDTLSRYVVTKHAWYKAYKRIFCITPSAVHTQNPERTLVLTNSYAFAGDSDIEGVLLGGDEYEFTLSARQDKKVRWGVRSVHGARACCRHGGHTARPHGRPCSSSYVRGCVCLRPRPRAPLSPLPLPPPPGQVQAAQVHVQAPGAAADRPVPVHGCSGRDGALPRGRARAGVSGSTQHECPAAADRWSPLLSLPGAGPGSALHGSSPVLRAPAHTRNALPHSCPRAPCCTLRCAGRRATLRASSGLAAAARGGRSHCASRPTGWRRWSRAQVRVPACE